MKNKEIERLKLDLYNQEQHIKSLRDTMKALMTFLNVDWRYQNEIIVKKKEKK